MYTRAFKIFLLTSLRVEIRFWSLRSLTSHLADPEVLQTLSQPHCAHLLAVTHREGGRQGQIHLRGGFTLSLNPTEALGGSEAVCEVGMAPAVPAGAPAPSPPAHGTAAGGASHSLGPLILG